VQLIISNLPTTGAPTYRALRTFAGKSPVQVLTLTKMEVWSVPCPYGGHRLVELRGRGVSGQPSCLAVSEQALES